MSFRNLVLSAFAIAALSACSGKNDSSPAAVRNTTDANVTDSNGNNEADTYRLGVPNYSFDATEGPLMVDDVVIDSIDESTFEGYPALASHVAMVSGFTRVVETKENSLEFYSADNVLEQAWDLRGEAPVMIYSRQSFTAESLDYARAEADQDQGLSNGTATFHFRECRVEEEEKEEGQEQEQGQDKGEEEQGQDQGMRLAGTDQDMEKGEDKGEDKGEEKPAEICKTASKTLNLTGVELPKEEKEQEQDKGEEQDQGKGEEEQGQDKGEEQDQGKGEEEQGQDKGQEEEQDQSEELPEEQDQI